MNTPFAKFARWLLAVSLAPTFAVAGTLSDSPLSLKGSVPPNVMFSLSVEFPTALVAAYQGTSDYSAGIEYKGYFDADKCYAYSTTNVTTTNTGYFIPVGFAASRACNASGQWSGNLLNWATMSGLDEFRHAMTGGHRHIDTATETVLERSFQNTQGNYFPNKTITNFGATGTAAALTLANYGKGVQMMVTATGSDTANCANPQKTAPHCSLTLASSGSTGTCGTWSGNGTTTTPYKCDSFTWSGGETFPSVTPGTVSVASESASVTVNCTSPTLVSGNFNCTLTNTSDASVGSCTTWTGTGSSASPFSCSTFGTFAGDQFIPATQAAAASFSATTTTTTSRTDTMTASACTGGGATATKMTCPLGIAGKTVSCKITSGSGSSSSPFRCGSSTVWTFNDATYSFNNWSESGTKTSYGGKYYRFPATVGYSYSTTSTATYYYIPSYGGSDSNTYRYYSTYNMSLSGTAYYNVRVRVCDTSIGQESNCKQYGSAWKPTGVVQDNGDKMRFGVMSYFMKNDIDNAALRSKLKYVAPQKYSASGGTVANSAKEWSDTDGTLIADPDSADAATHSSYVGAMPRSGVVNYINQFGSYPDPANPGYRYKGYDPIGKLYYETLRYLRGLAPTTAFYQGATAANADGFPVITTWDDPIQYSCQKNYIITLGDQFTHCDKRLPGGTLVNASGQCNAYTDGNGNSHPADGATATTSPVSLNSDTVNVKTETDAVGTLEGMTNLGSTATGAGSAGSYFMSGLAAWAAKSDIRPDNVANPATLTKQTVKTFIINVEENKACGYRSQFWLAAKYGNPSSYNAAGAWITSTTDNPWFREMALSANECSTSYPPPDTTTPLAYTRTGGGTVQWPKNLLRASNPTLMIESVRSAIAQIVAQIGDESALAQSSGSLNTGTGAYIYRATYNSSGWSGTVDAFTIDTTGTVSSSPAWTASARLPAHGARNILTFNDGLTTTGTAETSTNALRGVAFTAANLANLSTRQQDLLNRDEFGTLDGFATDRINYLRGEQSNEAPNGNAWRARSYLLGDNINSNPLYVAGPRALQPGRGYGTFVSTWANRKPMLYVGANDGMLHGYDASYTVSGAGTPTVTATSGTELLGYVPSAVYRNLSQLMSPNYSHKYYVDGSPVVAEAYFGASCATDADHPELCWKTLLVGGLNGGGQGIHALDVTDPNNLTADKVLWEFTEADDADLGYTFGRPIIRKLNFTESGVAKDRWAVIFGNGFNNTGADLHSSTTGRAYLYILLVDGPGAGNNWTLGTNYWKIELKSPAEPATPTLPLSPPNGLSAVTGVDNDQNGTVDYLYAGDRNGNVWKIDLTSTTPSDWRAGFGTVATPLPLFSATDGAATPAAQQITTSVEVQRHPEGGFMVLFGTGAWIDTTDPLGPFKTDSFYGIWDRNDGATRVTSRGTLQRQKPIAYVDATGATCTAGTSGCYVIQSGCTLNYTAPDPLPALADRTGTNESALCPADIASPYYVSGAWNQQYGWVFNLPGSGERIFSDRPKISGDIVTFTTLQPASDPCAGNTTGMEYSLDWLGGSAPTKAVYILPGSTTGVIVRIVDGNPVTYVPSGTTVTGGAADTGITFTATPQSLDTPTDLQAAAAAMCGNSAAFPTASCTGAACGSAFIPGWGFAWERQGGTSATKRCIVDCKPAQVGSALNCVWKINNDPSGRFSWRQIVR